MREANNIEGERHDDDGFDERGSQSESGETVDSDYYYDDSTGYEVYRDDEDESLGESEDGDLDDRPADV